MSGVIPSNEHFLTVERLRELGFSHYRIGKLANEGKIVKVSRSMYKNTAFSGDESDLSIVSVFAPKGVFCMMTAARYYGLTTYIPDAVDVAIERSMNYARIVDAIIGNEKFEGRWSHDSREWIL
ncbi:MAG: hypothetical protein IJS61_05950 [Firmicutes bacterium]|nr:hypothetical protein [Bacillota bacterium]